VQPVAVQSKLKRMQEGDVGTKSLYIPPIKPLSDNVIISYVKTSASRDYYISSGEKDLAGYSVMKIII
jgi:hypothetical protein